MKQYFTKYLPVLGEIKEGDYYIDNSLEKNTLHKCHHANAPNIDKSSDCRKVKLFLCTRDIQVGDTFKIDIPTINSHLEDRICTSIHEEPFGDNQGKKMYMINETGAHLKEGECFKVIGEISPEATWVTEGMDFDEDEIKLFALLALNQLVPFIEKNKTLGYPTIVKFKCPTCKTFH